MIESNLVDTYGMYSPEGDEAVHDIVIRALENKLNWKETYAKLRQLAYSNSDRYGEAMDTVVREYVYDAIGADERGENFYV
jgi:hypothetical protein